MQEIQDRQLWSLDCDGLLEEGMATRSSTLAGKIPRTEKPGGLRSTGSQVRHDWSGWAQPPHTQTHSSMPTPHRVCAISSLRGRVYLFQVRELYSGANPTSRWQMYVWGDAMRCPAIPSRKSAGRWEAGEHYSHLCSAADGRGLLMGTCCSRADCQSGWDVLPLFLYRCQNCSSVWRLTPEYLPSLAETGWNLGPLAAVL